MAAIKPHGGFVGLQNDFDPVWVLLNESGDLHLKTEKKKTHFVVRASRVTPEGCDKPKRAIVFLRRPSERGKPREASACLECCWGCYYNCSSHRIGMYCKALDKWATKTLATKS